MIQQLQLPLDLRLVLQQQEVRLGLLVHGVLVHTLFSVMTEHSLFTKEVVRQILGFITLIQTSY
jgi:hypothetical protein